VGLDKQRVMRIIKAAIREDVASGDITSLAVIPKLTSAKACIIVKEDGVLCGIDIAEWVFAAIDISLRFKPEALDGHRVHAGQNIALIEGHARSILSAERLVLNFLSFLSSVATETKRYVDKAGPYGVTVLDTRKTLPLMRYLQKYAVLTGGGQNHRMNLSEMVLVKDNHIHLRGSAISVSDIRGKVQRNIRVEVEADSLEQFRSVLRQKPDIIMLDNMTPEDIRKAVELREESGCADIVVLEASGGITIDNIEAYAGTGVDTISVGALTSAVRGMDFSLEFV